VFQIVDAAAVDHVASGIAQGKDEGVGLFGLHGAVPPSRRSTGAARRRVLARQPRWHALRSTPALTRRWTHMNNWVQGRMSKTCAPYQEKRPLTRPSNGAYAQTPLSQRPQRWKTVRRSASGRHAPLVRSVDSGLRCGVPTSCSPRPRWFNSQPSGPPRSSIICRSERMSTEDLRSDAPTTIL
jgi:hypothetical protein